VKVRVDADACVGHGRCYVLAPEIFGDDERGHCVVLSEQLTPGLEEPARRAEANCPEGAIHLEGE